MRQSLSVGSSIMPETVGATSSRRHYQFAASVETERATDEFTNALIAASRLAPKGKRDTRVTQLAKDLYLGNNKAGRTLVELLFGAQDAGVDTEQVVAPLLLLIALVRARSGKSLDISFDDLQITEAELQGVFDIHQWKRARGDKSLTRRREMLSVIPRVINHYSKMQEALEVEEYQQTVGASR